MAIVQISRITNRKGLQVDLPQLAGAELGWSIDERRLFIGNGTLEEGAPVIGNTEILTEFSDILVIGTNYTYKGEAAGYVVQTGPTAGDPVVLNLQTWLDQFATVKDFGATGDGVTDDTAAINRALYELYCREPNPQIRRGLFFPAGVYRVTETILIPPYATLYGEGKDNSIIKLDDLAVDSTLIPYVARTADSLQQYGVNIGTNSATPPQFITIANMAFQNLNQTTDVFLVENATDCKFQSVSFIVPLRQSELNSDLLDTSSIRFASTSSYITKQIVFDDCKFTQTVFGVNTAESLTGDEQNAQAVVISNGNFDTLYKGVVMGSVSPAAGQPTPTGFRIIGNYFDNIYAEGISIGGVSTVELNASGHNIFYDVGNNFDGETNPVTAIIDFNSNNNVSFNDMFERTDASAVTVTRINVNDSNSTGFENSSNLKLGQFSVTTGVREALNDNVGSATTISTVAHPAFSFNYKIVRNVNYRFGTINVSFDPAGSSLTYSDDFTQNGDTGITLTVTQSGTDALIRYTSTSLGFGGTIYYSVTNFS